MARLRLPVVVGHGQPARCPQCGMWVEPLTRNAFVLGQRLGPRLEGGKISYRSIFCWCQNWLEISYVDYVITELELELGLA